MVQSNSPSRGVTVFEYYPRLRLVKRYVEARIAQPIPLADAARVVGLERKYFSAYFKQKVGVSFRYWLASLRVHHAAAMLAARELQVTEVAFASGFGDLRTFERWFKRVLGCSPRTYKHRVRTSILRDHSNITPTPARPQPRVARPLSDPAG
jgi:transcriptional regulator GlxA family with amidase domain